MEFKDFFKVNQFSTSTEEEMIYEFIAAEIESGDLKKGIWTKALAESEWDEAKAKSFYVKSRFSSLKVEMKDYLTYLRKEAAETSNLNYLINSGLSEEDIHYLNKPITAQNFGTKYGTSLEKINVAIRKGKLKAVLADGELWVQNIKI